MSASLVGSEMCIRDRCTRGRGPCFPGASPQGRAPSPGAGSACRVAALKLCLLYTSDAADDM
eukprot:5182033-Alexandrium_andersonii.AAC.1